MGKFKSSIETVEAFKMHEMLQYPYEPKWFIDTEASGEINVLWMVTGRFGCIDPLRQSYAAVCKIFTHGGVLQANEGDYIVRRNDGEIFPCGAEAFERIFREAECL